MKQEYDKLSSGEEINFLELVSTLKHEIFHLLGFRVDYVTQYRGKITFLKVFSQIIYKTFFIFIAYSSTDEVYLP